MRSFPAGLKPQVCPKTMLYEICILLINPPFVRERYPSPVFEHELNRNDDGRWL